MVGVVRAAARIAAWSLLAGWRLRNGGSNVVGRVVKIVVSDVVVSSDQDTVGLGDDGV